MVVVSMVVMVMMVGMAMMLGLHRTGEPNRTRTRDPAMQPPAARPSHKLQGVVNYPSPE